MVKSKIQTQKWRRAPKIDHNLCADLLRHCGSSKSLDRGKQLHALAASDGSDQSTFLGNALIQMYGSCGSPDDARSVFDNLRDRNVFSWNILIVAYTRNGYLADANLLFRTAPKRDVVTWNEMLTAFSQSGDCESSRFLFARMPRHDVVSWNAMLAAFAQSGQIERAKASFASMPERNVVSWNAIVAAYAQNALDTAELQVLERMEEEKIEPNAITFAGALDTCGDLESGRKIHAKIVELGCEQEIAVATCLVRMYGRFGRAEEASKIFLASSSSRAPDLILVTAMVAAHAQSGQNKDALELFARMDLDGVQPDCKALSAIVDACSSSAEWKIIHRNMLEAGIVPDLALGTALINLYGKSGGIEEARAVFLAMEERNEVSWTAMVAAFAQTGHTAEALGFFLAMNVEGIYPDAITFVSVLSACSHGGKKSLARDYFLALQIDYGYLPGLSHFACLVDALGRSGELENAEALMRVMPFVPDGLAWITLVGACAVHGDWHRAVAAGVDSVTLNSESSAPYVLLYNILGFLEP